MAAGGTAVQISWHGMPRISGVALMAAAGLHAALGGIAVSHVRDKINYNPTDGGETCER